eukprot:Nk52_evm42s230 gene=Nk52_evmTU42s230
MSLFKCREWWAITCGDHSESFGPRSLCVAKVELANYNDTATSLSSAQEVLFVASLNGLVRAYLPRSRGYEPYHMLYEYDMQGPVLQLDCINYTCEDNLSIILLRNSKLSVFKLTASYEGGLISLAIVPEFEIPLGKRAHSFVTEKRKDINLYSCCVLTYDGSITLISKDSIVSRVIVPSLFLPWCMELAENHSTLLLANSNNEVVCVNYGTEIAKEFDKGEGDGLKQAPVCWVFDVGEMIVSLSSELYCAGVGCICVVAESSIWFLSAKGKVISHSCLDSRPVSSCSYTHRNEAYFIVCCEDKNLLLYRSTHFIWKTQTQYIPVAVSLVSVPEVKSLVVFLGSTGQLSCNYLGTDPLARQLQFPESRLADKVSLTKECKHLEKLVVEYMENDRNNESEAVVCDGDNGSEELSEHIKFSFDEKCGDSLDGVHSLGITVWVDCSGMSEVNCITSVTVDVECSPGVSVKGNEFVLQCVRGHETEREKLDVQLSGTGFVPSPNLILWCTVYFGDEGDVLQISKTIYLPLNMLFRPKAPTKAGKFKLMLKVSSSIVLNTLLFESAFNPFSESEIPKSSSAVGLVFLWGQEVTIVASKSRRKLQFHSDNFETLGFAVKHVLNALRLASHNFLNGKLEISFNDHVPIGACNELFTKFEMCVVKMGELKSTLESSSQKFKAAQRDTLEKVQSDIPKDAGNQETDLLRTIRSFIKITEKCQRQYARARDLKYRLGEQLKFIATLLCIHFHLSSSNEIAIKRALASPDNIDAEHLQQYFLQSLTFISQKKPPTGGNFASTMELLMQTIYDRLKAGTLGLTATANR